MPLKPREIAFTGRLRTADNPLTIQPTDFQQLTNLRYGSTHPRGVAGCTKINTAALANVKIKNGIQFRKDQPSESHALVHASDSNNANPRVYRNDTAIPSAGAFTATALWTDSSGSGSGRFSQAPDGKVLYANGVDTCIWGGDEMRVAGYQDFDPNGTYKYDYLPMVSNSLTDANNVATVHRYALTSDANTMLLLHCDGNNDGTTFTDSSPTSPHTVTANGNAVTKTAIKKFGTASGYFDGTGDYLTIPDDADFDFSGGTFSVDFWVYPTSGSGVETLYWHGTDADNYFRIYSSARKIFIEVKATTITVASPTADVRLALNEWNHIAVVESGNSWYIFLNGNRISFLSDTDRCANYTGSVYIGANSSGTQAFTGYIDEFRISNSARWTSNFTPPSVAYGQSYVTDILIGSTLPLKGINWYVGTANTTAGAGAVYYWDGTNWTTVGTVTGLGATAWDGAGKESWTFTSTASTAKLKLVDEVALYWYKVEVVDCDATTTIYQVTLDAAMQQLKDLWDGEYRACESFQVFNNSTYNDYTANVFENAYDTANEATFAKLGQLPSATGYLILGFRDRMQAIRFGMVGGYPNTAASYATVYYWNGTAWTALSVDDQTLSNNAALGKSGTIGWTPPTVTSEHKTVISGRAGNINVLLTPEQRDVQIGHGWTEDSLFRPSAPVSSTAFYCYKIVFSANLASDVRVFHIGGVPAQVDCRGYKFPFTHLNRAFLCNNVDAEPNAVICSMEDRPQTFNGKDSFKYWFGDGTGVLAAASFYAKTQGGGIANLAVFCKQKETWGLAGDTLESILQYRISDSIAIAMPLTMAVGEVEIAENVNRTVAMWQSQRGIEICDGGPPVCVSDDIADKFDPQHANYVGDAVLPTCTGFIDPKRAEFHWINPGVSEWVYDIRRKKWFQIDRGTGNYLYGGFPVWDANGVSHTYGFDYAGYMYRLENGTAFDGDGIAHTLWTARIAPEGNYVGIESHARQFKLIQKAKNTTANTVTVTHYKDSNTTGEVINGSPYSPANADGDLSDRVLSQRMPGVYHSYKMQLTTTDETVGFEPMMGVITYEPTRTDSRG